MMAAWLLLLCLLCVPAKEDVEGLKGVGEGREAGGDEMQVSRERRGSVGAPVVGSRHKRAGKRRRRKRCSPGLKMTSNGCVKAWSLTWANWKDWKSHRAIFDMKSKLERTLGIELETPCSGKTKYGGTYCEICTKTDPSRIHCPISATVTREQLFPHYIQPESKNISAFADYSAWQCEEHSGLWRDYSYWSMYDDGSICDCGSSFVVYTPTQLNSTTGLPIHSDSKTPIFKFRRPRENEAKQSIGLPASSLQSTRCSGHVSEDQWTPGTKETCVKAAFAGSSDVIMQPSIPAARCHSRPDISSIFEDETNGEPIEEEPIEEEPIDEEPIEEEPIEEEPIDEEPIEEEPIDEEPIEEEPIEEEPIDEEPIEEEPIEEELIEEELIEEELIEELTEEELIEEELIEELLEELIEEELTKTSCIEENTYLSWYNGEPIEEEVMEGGDATWCAAKCRANPSCDAWTLNTNNGWCALKRQEQVKRQHRPGYVSGFKTC